MKSADIKPDVHYYVSTMMFEGRFVLDNNALEKRFIRSRYSGHAENPKGRFLQGFKASGNDEGRFLYVLPQQVISTWDDHLVEKKEREEDDRAAKILRDRLIVENTEYRKSIGDPARLSFIGALKSLGVEAPWVRFVGEPEYGDGSDSCRTLRVDINVEVASEIARMVRESRNKARLEFEATWRKESDAST